MDSLSAQSVLIYLLPLDFKLALTSHIVSSVTLEENEKTKYNIGLSHIIFAASLSLYLQLFTSSLVLKTRCFHRA